MSISFCTCWHAWSYRGLPGLAEGWLWQNTGDGEALGSIMSKPCCRPWSKNYQGLQPVPLPRTPGTCLGWGSLRSLHVFWLYVVHCRLLLLASYLGALINKLVFLKMTAPFRVKEFSDIFSFGCEGPLLRRPLLFPRKASSSPYWNEAGDIQTANEGYQCPT